MDDEVIRSYLRDAVDVRRRQAGLPDIEFEMLARESPSNATIGDLERRCISLRHALRYSSVDMILSDVKPSLISAWVQRARGLLHEAILFYVNRLAMQQAAVNRLNLQALESAVALIKAQQAEIDQIKAALIHPGTEGKSPVISPPAG